MKSFLLAFALAVFVAVAIFVEQSYYDDLMLESMSGRYANAQSAFVTVDDIAVHYRDTGAGDKPPLLLLHGNSSSLHTWDAWAATFSSSRRVVRLDLPGFGLTGPDPLKRYGFKALTGFLARFCDQLGLLRVDVAGNSHGGRLAWAFAAEFPQRVHKLILLDAAGYPLNFQSWIAAQLRSTWPLSIFAQYLTPRFLVDYAVRTTYGDQSKVSDELVDHYFGLQLRAGNRAALGEMMTIYGIDDRDKIKSVQAPTLIQWGEDDAVIPVADAELFHRDIKGSQLIIYPGVGHMPMEEIPQKSAADAAAFLDAP